MLELLFTVRIISLFKLFGWIQPQDQTFTNSNNYQLLKFKVSLTNLI